jgi:putative ABC transport system permease protein
VQIIGYDPKTDFVIAPWLAGASVAEPKYGEVVIGGNLFNLEIGDPLQFFSIELDVVGKLERTGMGFDNSVFVNMETAQTLLAEYKKFGSSAALPEGAGADDVVSVILLDLKEDIDVFEFQYGVNQNFRAEGVRYVESRTLIQNTSKNLGLVAGILAVLLAAVWVFAVFALAIVFMLAINERRREFGILQAIGATRRKLTAIMLTEAALLCGAGALIGVSAVCLIALPFNLLIERLLQTAYLPPQSGAVLALLAACFALGAIVGPLAALLSAARIGKNDVFSNMREEL